MSDKVDEIIAMYPSIWKTRSAFFSWLKGCIRRSWNRHPAKVELLKKNRVKIPNENPRSSKRFPFVSGQVCSVCKDTFPEKECQVDHVLEETASLTQLSDIQLCVEKLLVVSESDLRIVCTSCHSIISLSQKLGISFEDAQIEQKVIALCKDLKKCLAFLEQRGYTGITVSNAEKRRNLVRQILAKEKTCLKT